MTFHTKSEAGFCMLGQAGEHFSMKLEEICSTIRTLGRTQLEVYLRNIGFLLVYIFYEITFIYVPI